jgi:hypothetical protein
MTRTVSGILMGNRICPTQNLDRNFRHRKASRTKRNGWLHTSASRRENSLSRSRDSVGCSELCEQGNQAHLKRHCWSVDQIGLHGTPAVSASVRRYSSRHTTGACLPFDASAADQYPDIAVESYARLGTQLGLRRSQSSQVPDHCEANLSRSDTRSLQIGFSDQPL